MARDFLALDVLSAVLFGNLHGVSHMAWRATGIRWHLLSSAAADDDGLKSCGGKCYYSPHGNGSGSGLSDMDGIGSTSVSSLESGGKVTAFPEPLMLNRPFSISYQISSFRWHDIKFFSAFAYRHVLLGLGNSFLRKNDS